MSKPVLLLDVDGVLAPFGCHDNPPENYDFIEVLGDHEFLFGTHFPEVMQRLMQSVELQWGTAWEDHANDELLEHLGLEDPLPVLYFDHQIANRRRAEGYDDYEEWQPERATRYLDGGLSLDPDLESWKLPWIKLWAKVNEGRALCWIDDECLADAQTWAKRRTELGIPTLFIRTDPSKGLESKHIDQIEEWAKEISDSLLTSV